MGRPHSLACPRSTCRACFLSQGLATRKPLFLPQHRPLRCAPSTAAPSTPPTRNSEHICYNIFLCDLRITPSIPPNCLLQFSSSLPCLTTPGQTPRALAARTSAWTTSQPLAGAGARAASSKSIMSRPRLWSKSLTRQRYPTSMPIGTTQRVRSTLPASSSRPLGTISMLTSWTSRSVDHPFRLDRVPQDSLRRDSRCVAGAVVDVNQHHLHGGLIHHVPLCPRCSIRIQ